MIQISPIPTLLLLIGISCSNCGEADPSQQEIADTLMTRLLAHEAVQPSIYPDHGLVVALSDYCADHDCAQILSGVPGISLMHREEVFMRAFKPVRILELSLNPDASYLKFKAGDQSVTLTAP